MRPWRMSPLFSGDTTSPATPAWRSWAISTRTKAIALAERYFEPIPGGSRALRPGLPSAALEDHVEIVLRDRVELDRLYLIWPTVPHFHGDDAALLLLGDVLARGRSSRLHRKLVIEDQIAQDVTAYQSGRELDGSFGIIVTLRPSRSISQALGIGRIRARRDRRGRVTDDELRRVQNRQGRQLLLRT